MLPEMKRIRRRNAAQKRLSDVWDNADRSLVIHYSCESFDSEDGRSTPRITGIAVRNLATGQAESFSIQKVAERDKIPWDRIPENHDAIEKEMLGDFFEFARSRQHYNWIHWNMRHVQYGFSALEHRFRVLGGQPVVIPDEQKFDLSRALVSIYGDRYIGHPRLPNLVSKNEITDSDLLAGAEEPEAFKNQDYMRLHRSTLRKVDMLSDIFEKAADGSLKTESTWWDRSGVHPRILVEIIVGHWIYSLVGALFLLLSLFSFFVDLL